jgi:hypothetical protein
MSDTDWRVIRRLWEKKIGKNGDEETRKLIHTFEKLHTDNKILRNENEGLRKAVKIEKDRRKRGKPLFNDLGAGNDNMAFFFSPNKIGQRRQELEEQQQAKEQIEREKAEKRLEKARKKEEREVLIT